VGRRGAIDRHQSVDQRQQVLLAGADMVGQGRARLTVVPADTPRLRGLGAQNAPGPAMS
jgi:hypothetical protein